LNIAGPVDGQWGDWGSWGSCVKDSTSSVYGTGETIRFRECDNPPAICGGDDCVASNNEIGNCRGKIKKTNKQKTAYYFATILLKRNQKI